MKIILSPIAQTKATNPPKITVDGLKITIDGQEIDLSVIPEGGQAEAHNDSFFIGIITQEEVMIKYPYSTFEYSHNQPTEWSSYTFEIESGEVPCPLIKRSHIV